MKKVRNLNKTSGLHPMVLLAKKTRVGQDDANSISLMVLIHFDAAKRGQCTNVGANFLTRHLIMGSYVAARTKSKAFHDAITVAYANLKKASDRPTQLLDLSTTEYKAIRTGLSWYLRALPNVEVGVMSEACKVADESCRIAEAA